MTNSSRRLPNFTRIAATAATLALAAGLVLAPQALAAKGEAGGAVASEVYVSEVVVPAVLDVDLRDLPRAPAWQPGDPIEVVEEGLFLDYGVLPDPLWTDPLRQPEGGGGFGTPVVVAFEGIPFTGSRPPDVVGDVGPNHYIEMVNASRFAIWDKDGDPIVGTTVLNTLWNGDPGSPCTDGDGDPIVQYDDLADRWLMTEFDVSGNTFCIYVSQGPNPVTDGWFVYDFSAPSFPDYPKYGVWPDAWYVTSFESPNLGIYAFDRLAMLVGSPATFQRFAIPQLTGPSPRVTRILPADADGTTPPPAGAPNYLVRTVDDTQDSTDPTDRLEVWEFVVDFVTPANSSLTQAPSLFPAAFTLLPCSPGVRDCVPQPNTGNLIDALFNRAMRRLQYRNFGTHETMVVTQVVDVGGGVAGKRWYELRKVGAGPWAIHQQGTYSPDSVYRFMGSMAMNGAGDIALGYSVSDAATVFPGIRVTARRAGDPAGAMTMDELTIFDGIDSQTASQRWGDYTSLNVDPTDGRTFWYTNQYIQAGGNWGTRVGSFDLDNVFLDGFESGDTSAWSSSVP